MAKNLREVFGPEKAGEQKIGVLEAVKEGIQAVAPGLSLREIFSDIKAEMKDQLAHGSHELSSMLFTGNSYVQYARHGRDDQSLHGSPEVQQQEQDRGGREM
jgi:methionine aminopeptidase